MTRVVFTEKANVSLTSGVLGKSFRTSVLGVLAAAMLLFAPGAKAMPLNLVPQTPDIVSASVANSYTAGTTVYTAFAVAQNLNVPPVSAIVGGSFHVKANIANAGVLIGGTVKIGGSIAGLGFNSGILLTGNLTALGFPVGGGSPIEFLFNVTGGDAAGLYGAVGGIILGNPGLPATLWAADWTGGPSSLTTADTFAVPVPGAVWLFGSGLLALLGFMRKSTRA